MKCPQQDGFYSNTVSSTPTSPENSAVSPTQISGRKELASTICFWVQPTYLLNNLPEFADFANGNTKSTPTKKWCICNCLFSWKIELFSDFSGQLTYQSSMSTPVVCSVQSGAHFCQLCHVKGKDLVHNNFYMDGLYESTDIISEAQRLFKEQQSNLQTVRFYLTK